MQISAFLRDRLLTLFATACASEAGDLGWFAQPIKQPFTPTPNLQLADLTLFAGSVGGLQVSPSELLSGVDLETGLPSVCGEYTNATAKEIAEDDTIANIYGWALYRDAQVDLLAVEALPVALMCSKAGTILIPPPPRFRFPNDMFR